MQNQDQVTQSKTCQHCQSSFDITQGDLDFYNKISPTFAGQKFQIPTATLCPDCRQRRRLSFRNERKLYRRQCDASGRSIISIYSPDKPYKVYDQKIWWSDSWDPMDYGFDFDFSKTFTENFGELMREVPKLNIINDNGVGSENCEYTNDFVGGKNCYMCFEMGDCKDSLFSHHSNGANTCVDCDEATGCSFCYEVMDSIDSYNCLYSQGLSNCSHCVYSAFLVGCKDCFLCCGLENSQYCYMNKQYAKEEYIDLVNKFMSDRVYADSEINSFYATIFHKHPNNLIVNSENCTGYNIMNSKNLIHCYNSFYSENIAYGLSLYQVKDSMDIQCRKTELCIEGQTLDESFGSGFCARSSRSKFIRYSDACHNSSHLFGCIGLRNKQYCIFNKQYTKEDYEEQVAKIITHMQSTGEWGEFFHPSLSPFGYNETVAQEYYPLYVVGSMLASTDNGQDKSSPYINFTDFGYKQSNYEAPSPQVDKVIDAKNLPHTIDQVDDSILQQAIKCEVSGKLFRVIPQELAFYRKHNIPLPRKHPDVRHSERMGLRN